MHTELENWNNGWFGLRIGLSEVEIDNLIENLKDLKRDPDQHFHISSDYIGNGGLGDIEISRKHDSEISDMTMGSKALAPGTEINTAEPHPPGYLR